jgi:hypothetical protein
MWISYLSRFFGTTQAAENELETLIDLIGMLFEWVNGIKPVQKWLHCWAHVKKIAFVL